MKSQVAFGSLLLILPLGLFASNSYYCPQNSQYIHVGMTQDQVISACGQPVGRQESNQSATQKVEEQQLIYNNVGTSTGFYGVWNIPTGNGGALLQINVINQKVNSVSINGSSSNSFSICGGTSIDTGDPVGKVYSACGNPSSVNNTYIRVPIPNATKPVVWFYQPGEYQPPISLTFVNGKLQSINN